VWADEAVCGTRIPRYSTGTLNGEGTGAPNEIFYFDAGGDLDAVRLGVWKITFTEMSDNLSTAWKKSPSWPAVTNLRREPYERFGDQGGLYLEWFGDRMFLMVPAQAAVARQMQSLKEFPPARGSSLSLGKLCKARPTLYRVTSASPPLITTARSGLSIRCTSSCSSRSTA